MWCISSSCLLPMVAALGWNNKILNRSFLGFDQRSPSLTLLPLYTLYEPHQATAWEVEEVTEQLVEVQKTGDPGAKERLEIELGDLAFDTLLLISLCRRDFPSARAESPYKMAADKVRRRVPYIWGKNGEKADSAEEAEAHWQRVKAEEKSEALARGNLISGTESSGGGWLTWTAAVLLAVGGAGVAAAKFKMLKV